MAALDKFEARGSTVGGEGIRVACKLTAAVAGTAQLLRRNPYIEDFDFDRAIDIANDAKGKDEFGYRAEFVQLLRLAKVADKQKPLDQTGAK